MINWLSDNDNGTLLAGLLAALAAIVFPLYQLLKSRTLLTLSLYKDLYEDRIRVCNKSAHDVTLSSAGVVTASGRLSDSSNEYCDEYMISPMLPRRLKARDEIILEVPFINKAYHNKVHHRGGVYVTTSDGKLFSDVSWLRRRWWWLLSVILKDSKR